ncbi:cobalamin-independent methionine synthase II family protein [Sporobolomyces salmoneus]|uniref:cobalamin-independent methionine synthase II family protein n=1 Tax=Sporobolomyces salmoneus TaxID=183962 RepID=UPI00317ECB8D
MPSVYPSNLSRAEHIGSLKRPIDLLEKREQFDQGKCTAEELRQVEDRAIRDVVGMQQKNGIKCCTDGEFRRHMFFDGFHNNLDGMVVIPEPTRDLFKFYVPDVKGFFESHAEKPAATMVCKSKLVRTKPMYRPEFEYTASCVKPEQVKSIKLTLAAPQWFHLRHGEHAYPKSVYANDAEYFADIAKAYREELADLYSAGCRNVQFDDPLLAYFCSEDMLEGMKAEGVESEPLLDAYIKLYNDCVRDVPEDMVIGLHLCRGNFKDGLHFSSGGYDRISRKLFNELNAKVYYLEYDTERAGGFEPLADLPMNKSVVLGILSSKLPELESEDSVIERIHKAADFVAKGSNSTREEALSRLALSAQCGYSSHSIGNRVGYAEVEAKLALTVSVAQKVWGPESTA